MNKRHILFGSAVLVILITAIFSNVYFKQHELRESPCTGTPTETGTITPCAIDTEEVMESGHGFNFIHPEGIGGIQTEGVSMIEHSILSEDGGPYYLITFYYNNNVNIDAFNTMFPNGKSEMLAGKSVIKSTEAKFPNPEYMATTAYYLSNNGKDAMVVIAADGRDMLEDAKVIFQNGFVWEKETVPSPFNITFKYGVGAKNILDTFNDTFTKDMIVEDAITVPMELTNEELAAIHKKVDELNIFETLEQEKIVQFTTPCFSYDILLETDGTQQKVLWNCEERGSNNSRLDELSDYIRLIVESKEAYKNLPEPLI
ncbi:MAG: hypothetical protein WCT28_03700 [Patescibacteria group bacterium]|jgi:hypothetical protein